MKHYIIFSLKRSDLSLSLHFLAKISIEARHRTTQLNFTSKRTKKETHPTTS